MSLFFVLVHPAHTESGSPIEGNRLSLLEIEAEPRDAVFMEVHLANVDPMLFIDTHILFDGSVMSIDRERALELSDRIETLDAASIELTEDAEEVILYGPGGIPAGHDVILRLPILIDPFAALGTYELRWGMVEACGAGLWSVETTAVDGVLVILSPVEVEDTGEADADTDTDAQPEFGADPDTESEPAKASCGCTASLSSHPGLAWALPLVMLGLRRRG